MPSFLQNMSGRERAILIVMVSIAVLGGIVFGFLKPKLDGRAALIKKQEEVQKEIAEAEVDIEEAQVIKEGAEETRRRLLKLREALPENSQLTALIVDLPQVVESSGVELVSFAPAQPKVEKGVTQLPVQISATGDFFDVLDFIFRVQNFPRYMKVNKVSLTPGASAEEGEEESESSSQITAQINLVSYYTAAPPPEPGQAQ